MSDRNTFPTIYDDGQTLANMAAMVWQDRPEALDATLADFADAIALARIMDACATITRRASAELVRRYSAPLPAEVAPAAKGDTCLNCGEPVQYVTMSTRGEWQHMKGNRFCEPMSLGTLANGYRPPAPSHKPETLSLGMTGICKHCVAPIHTVLFDGEIDWKHDKNALGVELFGCANNSSITAEPR